MIGLFCKNLEFTAPQTMHMAQEDFLLGELCPTQNLFLRSRCFLLHKYRKNWNEPTSIHFVQNLFSQEDDVPGNFSYTLIDKMWIDLKWSLKSNSRWADVSVSIHSKMEICYKRKKSRIYFIVVYCSGHNAFVRGSKFILYQVKLKSNQYS